jgi:uncharacterized protein (TIGR02099 family)
VNPPARRGRSARTWRAAAIVAAGLLLAAALVVGALRIAVSRIPAHAARIQAWVEQETGLGIEFERLAARLRWYGPEIVLDGVRVLDRDGTQALFATREGSIGLDLLNFLRTGEFAAARVRFVGPSVTVVRLADGRIRLLGLRDRPTDRPLFDLDRLPAGRVTIEDARVTWRDLARGTPPLALERVELALHRERRYASVSGSAQLPKGMGRGIEFDGRLKGSLDTLADLDARLEIRAPRIDLAGLAPLLPSATFHPLDGRGRADLELSLVGGRLNLARVDFDLTDVALRLPKRRVPAVETLELSAPYRPAGRSPLALPVIDKRFVQRAPATVPREARYAALAGELRLRHDGRTWIVRARRLLMARPGAGEPVRGALSGSWTGRLATTFATTLAVQDVRIEDAWPLVLAFAPATFDAWAGLDPSGTLRSFRLEASRERAGAWPRFSVSADVEDLAARPAGRWPGIVGLTAVVAGTDRSGELTLRANAPRLEWPRLFREPLTLRSASADVQWRREDEAWIVSSPRLELDHAGAHARASFEFVHEGRGRSPRLRLDAVVDHADVTLVRRVLPYGRLKPSSIAWLEQAFVAGQVDGGRLSLEGPVRRLPFRGDEGRFAASAHVSGVTLSYAPGFAPLVRASGQVEFRQAGLTAQLERGEVAGLRVERGGASIEDLREPVVKVDASATGDLSAALAVVQGSPLGPLLGPQFLRLSGSGPADYEFRLDLPTQDVERRDYSVGVNLRSVTVATPTLRSPAREVTGRFALHNFDLSAPSLRGTFLDGPFELSIERGPLTEGSDVSIVLSGSGRASGARLPEFIGLPQRIGTSGGADWKLGGRVERRLTGQRWAARLEVRSDLAGLAILAPHPFAKAAGDTRPTRVTLSLAQDGPRDVAVQSGSARAHLVFNAGADDRWDLERGVVRFDGQPAVLPDRPGVRVAGDWPSFDLGEWIALGAPAGGRGAQSWLGPIDVHLDEARVLGFRFEDVTARLQPEAGAWQVVVNGPMAQGGVTVPFDLDGPAPIRVEMSRLSLQSATPGRGAAGIATADPRTLPAIVLAADDLTWEGRKFGRVRADVTRDPQGLRLTNFESLRPESRIEGRGAWRAAAAGSETRLELEFSSSDFGATAEALGYPGVIDAEQARAEANLSWPGGPSADVIEQLDGVMHVALDGGQLLQVKPGASRVLGLTSIAALPRRLALDFRDVTDAGLSFDTVRGDFELRDGNAYTQNLLLKGAAVDIGIVGRTGLAAEDYDQTVVVSGNPSGPITVAGALAGGPVGAAGGLLLSQIFKGQLQGLARVYYRVTGPWANPVVQRVSAQSAETPAQERAGPGAMP